MAVENSGSPALALPHDLRNFREQLRGNSLSAVSVSIASPAKGVLMPNAYPSDRSDRLYTLAEAAAELQRIADALFDDPSDAPEHLLAALDDIHASYIAPGSEETDAEAEAE